ncbi:MAG: FtsX-like permease family protein, partial [Oleiphilaceae bacterium]|nr:FtsX-like permease family protein [Oleiphilaceae bacterium]
LVQELNTMLSTPKGDFHLVELLSTDDAYPLYGDLVLEPEQSLQQATEQRDGHWGVAIDPILAERLGLKLNDRVNIGNLALQVRALVLAQPDRRLNANWRGAPVLLSQDALNASGLVHPASRIEYEYRVRTDQTARAWKRQFMAAFPDSEWEVRTFQDRSERIAERLDQIASGLLIVAFSTLFIGGLGIFNSISVYLESKRSTIATLKSVGMRNTHVAQVYLVQVALLAGVSGGLGLLVGAVLAWLGSQMLAQDLPMVMKHQDMLRAGTVAWLFGVITAYTFTLPALGRALCVEVSDLFRDQAAAPHGLSAAWRGATVIAVIVLTLLVLAVIPNFLFGLVFVLVVGVCLLFFEGVVRALKRLALNAEGRPWLLRHAAWRFAVANLHRPGTPLRATLLSMGSALTLLVASSVVVVSLLRMVHQTIPEQSPALILYDVMDDQKAAVQEQVQGYDSFHSMSLSPLVRARISAINGSLLRERPSDEIDWQEMARDEHKLSYLSGNIDGIRVVEGALWEAESMTLRAAQAGVDFLFAMEDREAEQMQLQPGDTVRFSLAGQEQTGLLTAIYSQRGIQTRFWFEAIFSDGALDPFITMYVGTVYMDDADALLLQTELAQAFPNVITVRTEELVASAAELLGKATQGLVVLASISLLVSVMVLTSVLAAGRTRQTYHAAIMHCLGARLSYIRAAIRLEYALLAVIVGMFAMLLGNAIAALILQFRLKIYAWDVYSLGVIIAFGASALVFGLGAHYLCRRLRVQPATLLKEAV